MFWSWRKSKINRERILAFDLLRGSFLIIIITTHIAWSPSIYTFIGGGGALFASAAEGFFAISGILVGYLYGPKVLKNTKEIFKKIWKRAGLLYLLAVGFTLFYTAWAILEPSSSERHTLYTRETWRYFVDTFTLRYAFGWADFLTRYAVFMAIAPFAVWLIAKHKAWIVALISFTIWFFFREVERFLPFAAWQIIFMYGIIIGYYLPYIEDWFRRLSKSWRVSLFVIICGIALVTYLFSMYVSVFVPLRTPNFELAMNIRAQIEPLFNKNHLSPLRLLVGIIWLSALYMLFRHFEKQISKFTRGILEVFGRQSLFIYGLHAFVLFIIDLYFLPPYMSPLVKNTIVTTLVLITIYLAAYYRGHITRVGKRILSKRSTTQVP